MSDQPESRGILASRDFFFTTRITDTARALGAKMETVQQPAQFAAAVSAPSVRIVIVDLDSASDFLTEVPGLRTTAPDLQVIAFGSHVETARLREARQAGCQTVLPRSKFTATLAELLTTHLLSPS